MRRAARRLGARLASPANGDQTCMSLCTFVPVSSTYTSVSMYASSNASMYGVCVCVDLLVMMSFVCVCMFMCVCMWCMRMSACNACQCMCVCIMRVCVRVSASQAASQSVCASVFLRLPVYACGMRIFIYK